MQCGACRDALLERSSGVAYIISARAQHNSAIVVARGLQQCGTASQLGRVLADSAGRVAEEAGYRFDAVERAARGLTVVE